MQLGKGTGHGRARTGSGGCGVAAATATLSVVSPCPFKLVVSGAIAARRCCVEFHGQADAFAGHIHLKHFHLDDVAGLDHLARVVDELVAQLADVDQPVLVHAQIDKGAELRTPEATEGVGAWFANLWRWVSQPPGELRFIHANEIGTPVAVTDAQARLIWRAKPSAYTAYGVLGASGAARPAHAAHTAHTPEGFELNLRLPGQYFDEETGWHDNVLRTYDPQRGQYLEPDPLGPVPNWRSRQVLTQPFAYANHNPITYADPTGLILFAFDGTGNDDNLTEPAMEGSGLSNVDAFYQLYDDGRKRYVSGVGTVHEDDEYGDIVPDTFAEGTMIDWLTPNTPLFYNDMGGNYSGPARIDLFGREADAEMVAPGPDSQCQAALWP